MLGTLLEKLGTLLPKNFIIASFFPMLVFASMNALMLFWISERFRTGIVRYYELSPGKQALLGFPVLIAVALAAYIFSTLNLLQRETLEGEYFPRRWKNRFTAGQQRNFDALERKLLESKRRRRRSRKLKDNGIVKLREARIEGNELNVECAYSNAVPPSTTIAELTTKRTEHNQIDMDALEDTVNRLVAELKKYPVDKPELNAADAEAKTLLDADQLALSGILYFSEQLAENDYSAAFNKREFNYSSFRLAPTAMGNIAESVRGYARSRYALNLDPFWSRLQKVLIGDEKFYASLLDAKTQLDFLISLFWLTIAFTILWIGLLIYLRTSLAAFLTVAIAGPIVSLLWYRIALQNYRAFADTLRTSVDLYRHELLDALHIRRPGGSEQERRIWSDLNQIIGYGDPEVRVSYQQPQS